MSELPSIMPLAYIVTGNSLTTWMYIDPKFFIKGNNLAWNVNIILYYITCHDICRSVFLDLYGTCPSSSERSAIISKCGSSFPFTNQTLSQNIRVLKR